MAKMKSICWVICMPNQYINKNIGDEMLLTDKRSLKARQA